MNLSARDKQVIWHPYTQIKGAVDAIPIVKGEGSYLIDESGNRYLDAISSWWVNTHGHAHPHIAKKVSEQLHTLEHSIFAGFTHPKAVELAERILEKLPNQSRVFFSDNGSTAVEVALKMAFQYWSNKGHEKNKVIVLEGSYHGDTFGSMSVSARGGFNQPFEQFLFDVLPIPFPKKGEEECTILALKEVLQQDGISSIIVEPLIQGAAGMRMYSPEVLEELFTLCRERNVLIIADEVMTGFGRTGKLFATDYIETKPDLVCMSKGLTGGTMALGLTAATSQIYEAFISDDKLKTFFHGHSFTANAVACSAACASLDLFDEQQTWDNIARIEIRFAKFAEEMKTTALFADVRHIGTVIAFELKTEGESSYFNNKREDIYNHFFEKKIILRPLGNVIYFLPPYCIEQEDLERVLKEIKEYLLSGLIDKKESINAWND
ncbi:MAG: adenosylmethionine--8-amino-7-oxononanoate transaminase [Flavobacteriales bacterium]|nr:adenosylmethionine--8-amino-7-oxononanoate transaminase [Flavobacteriales bacterium]